MLIKRFEFLLRPSGNIEIARGIRTLLAIALPFILGKLMGQAEIGLNIGLAAQILLLADVGGLYSVRAKTLIGTTLGIAIALILGTWVSHWLALTVIVVACGLFLAGYLTVYGENGAAAGLVIGLALLFTITLPAGGWIWALQRASLAVLGGLWAMFLALVIWPFQPNLPLRRVVAQNFWGISQYLKALPSQTGNEPQLEASFAQVRQLLLQSRQTLADTRRGRWGRSDLRELLIVLIEDSDRIMTTVIAIRELLILHPLSQLHTVGILIEDVLVQVASITEDIAELILGKTKLPNCNRLKLLIAAIEQQQTLQKKVIETDVDDYLGFVAIAQLSQSLKKLQQQLQLANQTAQQLHRRDRLSPPPHRAKRNPSDSEQWETPDKSWWEPLQENFSLESPLFLHALRLGLGSALGVLIYTFAQIPHGLWIGLTLVIVLKPDFSLTFQRFFYRIIGTLFGAAVVSFLLAHIHDLALLEWIGILSMAIALSLVRFHYSLAVFFITLFVLILSELHPDETGVNVVWARVICTLIGAVLAFALSLGVLRPKEELRFSTTVVHSLQQIQQYFQAVMAVYLGEAAYQAAPLCERRNQARLANATMQTALQRLIDDPSTPFAKMEPAITLTNYIPRLGRGVTVLLGQLEQYSGSPPHAQVALFTEQVMESLTQLASAVQSQTPPQPLPPLETTVQTLLSHLQDRREDRLRELVQHQEGTSLERYLRDYNIVATELEEIVRRLGAIHTAIARYEAAVESQ